MKIYLHALSLFVLLFLSGLGSAAPVAIGDASFEGNTLTSGQANSNLSPEWQVVAGGAGFFFGNEVFTAGFAADGTDHLALLSGDQVWQDLGETFQANTVYTLKVAVGALAGFTEASNSSTYALGVGGTIYATASYNASQLAAGSFADTPDLVFDTAANPAVVGQPIRITLAAGGGGETYFDHLRLTTSFSQPAGTAVVVAGSASQLDLFSATLSGVVFNAGVSAPSVTFFYGTSDGGNNPAAWDSSVSLAGAQAAFSEFTVDVSALLRGQPYFFRVRASNAAGDSWSSSAAAFTTPDGLPVVNSFAAAPIPLVLGEDGTLSWQVTTAASAPLLGLSIDNGIGDVFALTDASGAGSIVVSPSETTTYILSANTVYGFVGSITTLTVTDPYATRINEFLANSGSNSLPDEDGDLSDWIELYNPESVATDLSTYYLTDDISQPRKWAFPAVTLNPGEYMLVFASGKDRAVAGSELHTNFSLSSGGEYLALTREDGAGGVIIEQEFAPTYPEQREGFSYGVNANGETFYFSNPSPGALNSGSEVMGFVEDTTFNVDRGFYSAPFDLTISSLTADAVIRYTVNGSEPTATTGYVYTGPIRINQTTIIRAAAFKQGFEPTDVDTQTYFFLDDIRVQNASGSAPSGWPTGPVNGQVFNYGMDPEIVSRYSTQEINDALTAIPSVSLTTNQSDLTGATQGIYVNAGNRGRSWERAASLEMIHPSESDKDFQENCGLRIRGGFSRRPGNPKHSFRLFFRKDYGASKLNYPLFGAEGADGFEKMDFRTPQNYSWAQGAGGNNTFLREILGRDLQRAAEEPYTRSRYFHLYLNGVYWGIYMTHERAEARFGESYLGGDTDDYDTIKSGGGSQSYRTEATDGSFAVGSDWHTLWSLARSQRSSPTQNRFMQMQGLNSDGSRNPTLPVLLDVENLITYQMIFGYIGHLDGPISTFLRAESGGASNNWYGIRDRERDNFGFQFFIHDGEHSLGIPSSFWPQSNDRMNTQEGASQRGDYDRSNPAFLHLDLAESTTEYRMRFADYAHAALFNDGFLSRPRVMETLNQRRETVSNSIIAHSARWGDAARANPFDEADWKTDVNSMIGVINTRAETFLGHLQQANIYPDLTAPRYTRHGGEVEVNTTVQVEVPKDATHLYTMMGGGDSNPDDWQDDLDPRLLGGAVNPAATMIPVSSSATAIAEEVFVASGDLWRFLDDGSNQGHAWREPGFDDTGWQAGASQLGYGDGDEATVIQSGPSNSKHATAYFRKEVTIANPASFADFRLKITFDDSYVVYVNGVEAARHSALPKNPPFDLYTEFISSDNEIERVSLSSSLFIAGQNTIAVEIHQVSSGSSDLSFDLELKGRPTFTATRLTVALPQTIMNPTWVKSRTYNANTGEWSALNQAFFTTISELADTTNLVISEVHYHPLDPTAAELAVDPTFGSGDFEFIEIMNISNQTVDLSGAAFVKIPVGNDLDGVEFTFPDGAQIAPGGRQVIVANAAAFAARYPGVAIAGEYSSGLSNGGEWITLHDAEGEIIDSFRYNDKAPWPVTADGDGYSLVLNNPASQPNPADPANWSASQDIGGSPGASDGKTFTGDPLADLDGDGRIAILEYAQGNSDDEANNGETLKLEMTALSGENYATVSYREDPSASDVSLLLETSTDLTSGSWTTNSSALEFIETTADPDGIPRHTYRTVNPVDLSTRRFFRLKVTY